MTRIHILFFALIMGVFAFAPIPAAAQPAERSSPPALTVLGRIVATAGVGGELVRPACHEAETGAARLQPLPFSAIAETLLTHRRAGELVIDTGGLLARHGVMHFAAEEEPAALARLAVGLGYHALALGEADLADPRALLLARARALKEAGVPLLATNLECTDSATPLCNALWTARDGVPRFHADLAVFSFIDPEALIRIAQDRRDGLTLLPLETSIRDAVRAARRRGITTVVAVIDSGWGAEAITNITRVLADLASEDKPDVVLSSEAGSELLFARPASVRPGIVAPPPRGASELVIRRQGERYDLLATPLDPARLAPAAGQAAISAFIERIGPRYCEALGDELPGGHLDRPMTAEDLVALTAAVMRERTGADLPILNPGVIDPRWQAHGDTLSSSDVQVGVQYDEHLVMATVDSYYIRSLARTPPDDLIIPGLTIVNPYTSREVVKINGRLWDESSDYQIVTIAFLAEGGDGTLPEGPDWQPVETASVRSVLQDYLQQERTVDPRDALVDPSDEVQWIAHIDGGLTFTGNAVRDPAGYAEGPLTGSQQILVGLESHFRLSALSRSFAWDSELAALYALASTPGGDGFVEGTDQLTFRTSAQLRHFRVLEDEVYVPDIFIEGLLRTEFTPSAMRDSHFMNVRFTAGPQWRLHLKVKARLLAGVEIVEAIDDNLRRLDPGVGAQLLIAPWPILREWPRLLSLSSTFDYFVSNFGANTRHLIQANLDLNLDVTRTFGFALNFTVYGLRQGDEPFAFAMATTANIRVGWNGRWVD